MAATTRRGGASRSTEARSGLPVPVAVVLIIASFLAGLVATSLFSAGSASTKTTHAGSGRHVPAGSTDTYTRGGGKISDVAGGQRAPAPSPTSPAAVAATPPAPPKQDALPSQAAAPAAPSPAAEGPGAGASLAGAASKRVTSPALAPGAADPAGEFAKWHDAVWAKYRSDFPAEAESDAKAAEAIAAGWRSPLEPETPNAPHFNHFEECHTGSYDEAERIAAGVLRKCGALSRWCAAYDVATPRERFLPPSVYGSLSRWANNFVVAYRIGSGLRGILERAGLLSEAEPGTHPALSYPDRDVPEVRPLDGATVQPGLMCLKGKDEDTRPAVWVLTHATGHAVCAKTADWYVMRSYHMCPWDFDRDITCGGKPCPVHDEVLHVSMQKVNKGEFGHHIEQAVVPLLPFIDFLLANPGMKLTLQGASDSDVAAPPHKLEGLIQYFEALGVDRSRLIDTPYQARVVWVARFTDLAGDQGYFWPARAAAWSRLGMHDEALPRILCPGAEDEAAPEGAPEPCRPVKGEDDPLAASPFGGAPSGVPQARYLPAVDVPIVLINRTGRRRIVNFEALRAAVVGALQAWQGEGAFSGVRLRLLVHHDAAEHNADKAQVMRMYAQARVVIGAHGAGLTHKFLMRPASVCLEYVTRDPPGYEMTGWVLMATSARSGLEHHALVTPEDHKKHDDYTVDVDMTLKSLRTAAENVVARMDESLTL